MNKKYYEIISFFSLCLSVALLDACQSYLDAKPDEKLIVPKTLDEYQAILDNNRVMNGMQANLGLTPQLGELAADDYYVNDLTIFPMITAMYRDAYMWPKKLSAGAEEVLDWNLNYRAVIYANVVLEGLTTIKGNLENNAEIDELRGSALFFRAHTYWQLAQVFCPPYGPAYSGSKYGLPLRRMADVNEKLSRASLEDTYQSIIHDLHAATSLLPDRAEYPTRPSKAAAFGMLARVYLCMLDYRQAGLYADSCLRISNQLLNFNDFKSTPTTANSFTRFIQEVIFHCNMLSSPIAPDRSTIAAVDSNLYKSYQADDLRKQLYFKSSPSGKTGYLFRGSYDGSGDYFSGLAVDEVMLMKAECQARQGNSSGAMETLNQLLVNRYDKETFVPFQAEQVKEALQLVLSERRKELQRRGLRWTDLRRLNQEPERAITIYRIWDGVTYSLPPNDPRYTFPIPDNVIGANPAMFQNER